MISNNPQVTVYIPTKNRCNLLQRAVQSVLVQSYQNFELIIVDDGSTDGTSGYLAQLVTTDNRVRYFTNEQSKGACYSRNLAIKNAKAHFVTGLDDDDAFLPHRLQSLLDAYDPQYAFICAGFYWDYGNFKIRLNSKPKVFSLSDLLNYNEASNQVLVERERIISAGGFDELFVACQDYDTWTRLMMKFGNAKRIKGVSYIYYRDKNISRLTKSFNWLKGHEQFMEKHQLLMSNSNIVNQAYMRLMAKQQRLGFFALLPLLFHGAMIPKFRYFILSNLRMFISLFGR